MKNTLLLLAAVALAVTSTSAGAVSGPSADCLGFCSPTPPPPPACDAPTGPIWKLKCHPA
jgi:hypothetical protein